MNGEEVETQSVKMIFHLQMKTCELNLDNSGTSLIGNETQTEVHFIQARNLPIQGKSCVTNVCAKKHSKQQCHFKDGMCKMF